jgi:hypothetical protein
MNELLKELKIDGKLKETSIINAWGNVLGKKVESATTRLYIKNQVLFVYLKSAVIKNELMMLKSGIIKALNEKAGENVIKDIVIR